jgi:protein-tyrosine-phosphatase
LKALRRAGISVVAIHHHMTHEEPRILFLHYWGVGSTEDLARGLRSALDETRPEPGVVSAGPTPTVVFVCEHGSAKSLVAASFFERLARERGLKARVLSRGTLPDPAVPEAVVRALGDDGFDVASFQPQALTEADLRGASRAVAIGVDISDLAARTGTSVARWDDIPPVSASYPAARAAIVSRVESLLRDLEKAGPEAR